MRSTVSSDRIPVVGAAFRTPVGRIGGTLSAIEPASLAVPLIRKILAETGLPPDAVDDVILGNAANSAGNLARLAALEAGLPVCVPGMTIDRQCGSGLEAIALAARLVQAGAGRFYLAGGTESTSRAHLRFRPPSTAGGTPEPLRRARMAPDTVGDPDMGIAAENVAAHAGISRERQDLFALESHRRAVAAQKAGRFAGEIVPVDTPAGPVSRDECPRENTALEKLAALKPVFRPGGTVTAGNACPVNDGAAVVLVTSLAEAQRLGLTVLLEIVDSAVAGVDPNLLGLGPVPAMRKLAARHPGLDAARVPFIEFNEAFASQVLASLDALGIDPAAVNREGGALALGHPYGASGAILVTRLFAQMRAAEAGAEALAMMGVGGGMGIVTLFRKL
ncbi:MULTISPECIES: thiolase family protein [unclassified Shinella]|uniref:thiolase family protein n=1 Tax=unclassified Shinella TaxID=2643062 RepID=UPI00225CC9E0|nr:MULTISPECIES: thiolase family protein [unclassified Shinella]MCO5136550.1 thiolase family protein [Shinella sp.]MDC7253773.1 thiolase family protein [Shinella sp. YE25]CAI0336417.1 putative acetyl-CoA C-acetyltransferase VraB [Rhizobiaceae bacterium]CAK7254955.1 putative acetyl-CoA C-acetyltransferase VraB [Shinella sp. WSC3-e]